MHLFAGNKKYEFLSKFMRWLFKQKSVCAVSRDRELRCASMDAFADI